MVHQQIYSYWLLRLHAPKRLNYFNTGTIINIVYAHIITGFWTMSKVTKWMLYQSKLSQFLYSLAQSSLIYKKLVTSPHSTQTHPLSLSLNNISTYHQKRKKLPKRNDNFIKIKSSHPITKSYRNFIKKMSCLVLLVYIINNFEMKSWNLLPFVCNMIHHGGGGGELPSAYWDLELPINQMGGSTE